LEEIEAMWKRYDLVVMDEVVYAITSSAYPEKDFLALLKRRPKTVELVLTGRGFPKSILEKADYVTEMKQLKHPFTNGFLPRKGVEF
jgi:cob(I)alamin adenosyltransferase